MHIDVEITSVSRLSSCQGKRSDGKLVTFGFQLISDFLETNICLSLCEFAEFVGERTCYPSTLCHSMFKAVPPTRPYGHLLPDRG